MPKKKSGIFDYIDEVAVKILKLMKGKEKRYSELQKESPLSPGAFNSRINQLIELKFVEVKYDLDKRHPVYILTPTGERILELLEEIEKVYNEGVSEEEKFEKEVEKFLHSDEK